MASPLIAEYAEATESEAQIGIIRRTTIRGVIRDDSKVYQVIEFVVAIAGRVVTVPVVDVRVVESRINRVSVRIGAIGGTVSDIGVAVEILWMQRASPQWRFY